MRKIYKTKQDSLEIDDQGTLHWWHYKHSNKLKLKSLPHPAKKVKNGTIEQIPPEQIEDYFWDIERWDLLRAYREALGDPMETVFQYSEKTGEIHYTTYTLEKNRRFFVGRIRYTDQIEIDSNYLPKTKYTPHHEMSTRELRNMIIEDYSVWSELERLRKQKKKRLFWDFKYRVPLFSRKKERSYWENKVKTT